MDNYHYAAQFSDLLGIETVNLARAGSCNRRILRTTIDYIEKNSADIVIVGLTFYDRQESPFVNKLDPWVSYNSQGIQAVFSDLKDYQSVTEYKLLGEYVQDRYRYDINQHYIDHLFLDLKLFAGYLRNKNIKFCIFNTCDRHYGSTNLGPGFVPFDFIGNEYLEFNGCKYYAPDADLPANARHHYNEDVIILTKYLADHIK